jgi:DUF1680 family protein
VKADVGRVALRRGPLVYCLEGQDQPAPLHRIRLPRGVALSSSYRADLLGGIAVIEAVGQAARDLGALYSTDPAPETPVPLTAVPYYIWCNRGANPMQVWVRE